MVKPKNLSVFTFAIRKQNDRSLVKAGLRIGSDGPFELVSMSFVPLYMGSAYSFTVEELETDKEFQEILASESHLVREFIFTYKNDRKITINRHLYSTNPSHNNAISWFDMVNINPGIPGNQEVPPQVVSEYSAFVLKAHEQYGAFEVGASLVGMTTEEGRALFQARETAMGKMEDLQQGLFGELRRFIAEQATDIQTKRAALETEHAARMAALEATYTERQEELESRERDLEARRKEIDDRDNRTARRSIFIDLKRKLEGRSTKFELTQGTRLLRWYPILATGVVIGVLVFLLTRNVTSDLAVPGPQGWFILGRQMLMTLTIAVAGTYIIRLLQRWAQRHAEEEFQLKRLDLDIDRASWLESVRWTASGRRRENRRSFP